MKIDALAESIGAMMSLAEKRRPKVFWCRADGKIGAIVNPQPVSTVLYCSYCKDVTSYALSNDIRRRPVLDHIVPKAKGGSDSDDNLALVCGSCNSSKRHHDFIDWMCRRLARTNGHLSWVNRRA